MLVLRRKVGESIILGGVISISVLAVEGERVKIGISAPPEVTIVREELLRSGQDQHQQAAANASTVTNAPSVQRS
ncbi:MAG: carbon storage regulator [Thermogemmatispora sp.]|jgi:carbon storage regulator|uniref:Translational regulator CsrA n=2 Tax=Thermogemmatispora TaxID=768669 RepID=A0A328VQ60_9CHLR|nr:MULTISPECIES: carbon storage regulator [Thermogemmatispora]MBE3566093.1 carbon storage regulator [Thermogemmatispora sp.]MBX5459141.1 carbon storage regulator [Thermogemmatispora sp.]RAQ97870.1 hypothetical protein A4R35_20185 [Thermogemmatispora tikiterensis]GER83409.1 carbon storage regulator [Thermogemmatispora aurantia]